MQNGYNLSGSIVVLDTATNDGILTEDEVVDWEWTAIGSLPLEGAYQIDPIVNHLPTQMENIEIDSAAIYLPIGTGSLFVLEEYKQGLGRDPDRIIFGTSGGDIDRQARYWLSLTDEGDIGSLPWSSNLGNTSSKWVIAVRVPEPTALLLITTAVFILVDLR